MRFMRICEAPTNIGDFIAEITPAFTALYGDAAGRDYAAQAPLQLPATIAHPSIRAYAGLHHGRAEALLFVRSTGTRHVIAFIHVLTTCPRPCAEGELLQCMLDDLPATESQLILTEYISFSPLALEAHYHAAGFHGIPRLFMRMACQSPPLALPEGYTIRTAVGAELLELADVLAATYEGHPEQFLFEEVTTAASARVYLQQCAAGQFGPCPRDCVIGAWFDGVCVGLVVGSEVVSEMGFVLHMAVLPPHQARGVGRGLLNLIMTRFYEHGFAQTGLVVTADIPAVKLYMKAGFTTECPIPVYYRAST